MLAVVALAGPSAAQAVTVTVGRQSMSGATDSRSCSAGPSQCQFMLSPTAITAGTAPFATVPDDGSITAWRVRGAGPTGHPNWALRVLRPAAGGTFTVVGATDFVTIADGSAIPLNPAIPVNAGDSIAVFAVAVSDGFDGEISVLTAAAPGAAFSTFPDSLGSLYAVGTTTTPSGSTSNAEPLFNADVALEAPVISSVSPNSGSAAGGETVTISGDHLANASAVDFGNAAATSFSVVSNTTITAVTPPASLGGVDVSVTTPGGTATAPGAFTFATTGAGPVLGGLDVAPNAFRAANIGDSILLAAPVAATVSYQLSEPATVTFRALRATKGRRVRGHCVRPRPSNSDKPKCTRYVRVKGSFSDAGEAGANSFRFSGRVGGKALRPGRYRLSAVATDTAGRPSPVETTGFRIVR